ncbi:MAG: biotin--[Blautia sp.]|nr:biotin--[acetyl-CoA-carboxylase] ligase [Blautia sp.]
MGDNILESVEKPKELHMFSEEDVRSGLVRKDVLVQVLESTVSTNRDAKEAAENGAPHGSVIASGNQTGGRGRRGKSFFSPAGGLYLSVIVRPGSNLKDGVFLTTAAAVAVCRAVHEVCGLETDIKWINDIYRDGRKICGILAEAGADKSTGKLSYVVVGIGVNLWIEPAELPEELKSIVGCIADSGSEAEKIDRSRLTASIVNHLLEEAEADKLSDYYIERNIIPGHIVEIREGDRVRSAFAESIEPDGSLLVKEEDGTEKRLFSGEVSLRIIPQDQE